MHDAMTDIIFCVNELHLYKYFLFIVYGEVHTSEVKCTQCFCIRESNINNIKF